MLLNDLWQVMAEFLTIHDFLELKKHLIFLNVELYCLHTKNMYGKKLKHSDIEQSCIYNHLEVFIYLSNHGGECTPVGIEFVIYYNNTSIMRYMLENGLIMDVNRCINTAVKKGHLKMVTLLHTYNGVVTNDAISWAVFKNRINVVKFLWSRGIEITHHNIAQAEPGTDVEQFLTNDRIIYDVFTA
jgi:hypothetical protein